MQAARVKTQDLMGSDGRERRSGVDRGAAGEAFRRASEPAQHLQHAVTFGGRLRPQARDGGDRQRTGSALREWRAHFANCGRPRQCARAALVIKRGAQSTFVYARGGRVVEVPTFGVEVLNVLGAGDAFAAGFLYGYLKGWDLRRSTRMGNACGAIVVTRHGCANFMPYEEEALAFIEERGGF